MIQVTVCGIRQGENYMSEVEQMLLERTMPLLGSLKIMRFTKVLLPEEGNRIRTVSTIIKIQNLKQFTELLI